MNMGMTQAELAFLQRMPSVLMDITKALEDINKTLKQINEKLDKAEKDGD